MPLNEFGSLGLDPTLVLVLEKVEAGTITPGRALPLLIHCGIPKDVAEAMLDVKPVGPPPPQPPPVVHNHFPKEAIKVSVAHEAAPHPQQIVVPPAEIHLPKRGPLVVDVEYEGDKVKRLVATPQE